MARRLAVLAVLGMLAAAHAASPEMLACVKEFNAGHWQNAIGLCNKEITAHPDDADAYFIKGASLYSTGIDAGKSPPGTAEALKRYIAMAPNGAHVADAQALLDAIAMEH